MSIRNDLEKLSGVSHVETRQDIANVVISASKAIKNISVIIMIILLIISILIISNTVRLTVFNRRKEINIMKYIGATDRFIRIPFIIEGVLIGLFGAMISFSLVTWGYIVLYSEFTKSSFDIVKLLPYINVAPVIAFMFVIFGCLIGIIGSSISMRKYLKV